MKKRVYKKRKYFFIRYGVDLDKKIITPCNAYGVNGLILVADSDNR